MKRLISCFILAWISLFASGLAQATPVTIQITGIVTAIRDLEAYPYSDAIYAGVSFTGTYTYDSATIDSNPETSLGSYIYDSPYGFNISLGGFEFKTVESHISQFEISLYDNFSLQTYDKYRVQSNENLPLSTGLNVNSITWSLYDESLLPLSSANLQSVPPDIDTWDSNTFIIGCGGLPYGNATFAVWGTVTEAVLIPEAGTLVLLGLGGLMLRKRKR